MKSKAAYTNKWLRKNKHLWCEKAVNGHMIIILSISNVPNIVRERVREINAKRMTQSDPLAKIINSIEYIGRNKKVIPQKG